jgi:hypothetical protein
MSFTFPYTTRPEDVARLLQLLPSAELPAEAVEPVFFKSLGFTAASGRYLLEILKQLGFIEENGRPSPVWLEYTSAANRGQVLAVALLKVYVGIFKHSRCPYLDDDETILEYFKDNVSASGRDLELMLATFRSLIEPADFQDMLADMDNPEPSAPLALAEGAVRVDPAPQFNIQVHIDASTPDEKIEVIFKNMRKYLLGKTD